MHTRLDTLEGLHRLSATALLASALLFSQIAGAEGVTVGNATGSSAERGALAAPAAAGLGKSPLGFVANAGQVDARVRYYTRGPGYGVYFTRDEAVFSFAQQPTNAGQASRGAVLGLRFLGSSSETRVEGRREGTAKVNYLTGSDPAKWHTGLSTYGEIVYADLWNGVDLAFRQANGQIKYEFVLQPGVPVKTIQLAYRGAESLSLDDAGNLLIRTARGVLTDERPTSYQLIGGKQVPVESRFVLQPDARDASAFSFAVGAGYDPRYPLVVDPGLVYSRLLGGAAAESGNAIALDPAGNAYVAGETTSTDFPLAGASYDTSFNLVSDAFVAKLDSDGNLVYATYLGGSGDDKATGVALSCDTATAPACRVYVSGSTKSDNFPTASAIQGSRRGLSDAFVTVLNTGLNTLVYSTYLGGSQDDFGTAIAVDVSGNAYITGWTFSSNFPTSKTKFQSNNRGGFDAFVTKLDAKGQLFYSSYLGGSANDYGTAIAVDASGNAYIAGQTLSSNFPVSTTSASTGSFARYDATYNLNGDAFVAKLNSLGTTLLYSTYLGGSGNDAAYGIAVDATGKAYVTGRSESSNFPITFGAYGGNGDAFVAKLDPAASDDASRVWITYLGGSALDAGYAIAVDSSGRAHVTGETSSANLPATSGAFDTSGNGGVDAFVARLDANGSTLYLTYLGGNALDKGFGIAMGASGDAYVTGLTESSNFPDAAGGGLDSNNADAFVVRLDVKAPQTITVTTPPPASATYGTTFAVAATASSGLTVAITTSGACSGSGSGSASVTMKSGTGTCTVRFNQAGDATYKAAPEVLRYTIAQPAAQAPLTLNAVSPQTYNTTQTLATSGGSTGGTVTYGVTSGSCSVSGALLTANSGTGSCVVTATMAGNSNYLLATASATVTLQKAAATITLGNLVHTYDGTPKAATATTNPPGLTTVTITYNGSPDAPSAAGIYTDAVVASLSNDNYAAPSVKGTLTINIKPEVTTLTLSPPLPKTNDTLTVTATTSDPDGNPSNIILSYIWKINGEVVTGQTGSSLDLSQFGDKGQIILVEVTPFDGISYGTPLIATVVIADSPPVMSSVPDKNGTEKVLLQFVVDAAADPDDPTGSSLQYSASNLPAGATFNEATRTFSWIPTSAQGGTNPYLVNFTVSDGEVATTTVARIFIADSIGDRDSDGIPDDLDNCPDRYNPDQFNVCSNSTEAVTAAATVTPPGGNPANPINVTATFTFDSTTGGTSLVPPNIHNVICRVTNNATGQQLPFQRIAEGMPIILSNQPAGDLIPLAVGSNVYPVTFDLRTWYPDLQEGSYTVVCTYVNFAHIPVRELDDPIILKGEWDAWFTFFLGLYNFGDFQSPADHEPFNQGRTVPVKFQLRDSAGALVTTATVRLFVQRLVGGVLVGSPIPATSNSGTGNIVPYNASGNQYQYNMKTDSLAVGEWQLQAQLDDGTTHVITIVIR